MFGLIHPSDSYTRLHFYKNRYPPSQKNESTCHLIVFQVSFPHFSDFFVLPLFSGGSTTSRGCLPTPPAPRLTNPQRLPTKVLPEQTDLSEASMTEERGEEIKTQLKEMSLGFLYLVATQIPSREWIHIPPWERENHLQKCHFWGIC